MGLLDNFRRVRSIADVDALEDFLDTRAAFLVQKCVFEYSRARAGIFWEKLFREPEFMAALDGARWNGYPIALGNVAEMVEGHLRSHAPGREGDLLDGLTAIAEAVLFRYPVPDGEPSDFWNIQAKQMRERLTGIQQAPPKPVKDIPLSTARAMFDLMPIHKSLRGGDFETVRNHLRSNLCRMSEEFAARARMAPLAAATLEKACLRSWQRD